MLGFALRAGFTVFFFNNLATYASAMFTLESEAITIVGGGPPWPVLDTMIGQLLGTGPPPLDISKGLIGIIGAAVVSTTPLGIIAFVALSAVINILLFIFRVVFNYLMSIVTIGFMICLSPLVLPMLLFARHTERFFNKWL